MFRRILSVITLILVVIVVWGARANIVSAVGIIFNETNPLIILLLLPEQLMMYYSAGQIFFSYMHAKRGGKKLKNKEGKQISNWTLMRVALELNFVNHAIPSGGVSGLGYITWRLSGFGASAGQVSFMYILRYAITIIANQTQTIIAIIILIATGTLAREAYGLVGIIALMSIGIIGAIAVAIVIASSRKRIDWFTDRLTKFVNWLVAKITFGRKKHVLKYEKVHKYLLDLHGDLVTARQNKKILVKPILWGVFYNFLEIATYEVVAISMGHPEIFPQIMVAEAIGSLVGAVMPTPGGTGGYEASMAGTMALLGGVTLETATAVVVATRVLVLLTTVASGYGFYQHAISKIGKRDKAKLME